LEHGVVTNTDNQKQYLAGCDWADDRYCVFVQRINSL